jgi:peptidyl-prolyl cis-trans isomerase D
MLKFFSRLERTRNFVLLIFGIIMVLSLVLFYAPSSSNIQTNLTRSDETLAKVSSEYVTVGELATMLQSSGRKGMAKRALDNLISQRLLRVEAKRLGFLASDAEIADAIRKAPQFNEEGKGFNQKAYEQFAVDNSGSVAAFEQTVRDQLSAQKLEAFLTSGVTVTEEEVLKDFQRKNTKFDLSYIPVSATNLAETIKPTDDELKTYFDQNKQNFYIAVPQKKIRYIFLNSTKVGSKLPITDEDLKAEFEKVPADKKIKGVEGQEIVLRVPKPEFEQEYMQKANEIVTQARKDGEKSSEEAFAELARGRSENPKTAPNGGKIAGLVKENPSNATDPYQQLLKMQPGDVSEPISYKGRIFILRRGEAVPKTFEDAKIELTVSLKNRKADTAALQLAQKINDRLKEVKDVQKVVAEFAAQANMSAKEMVRETGYIKPGDDIENVGVSPDFEQGIAVLENPGDVGEKFRIKDGFAIPMLVEKRDPRDAEFGEVKTKVAEAFKNEKARTQVEEIAKQIAAGATSPGDLTSAAEAKGLKAEEQKSFILGSPLGTGPSAATSEALEDAIYNLRVGDITKTPVKVNDSWYIVGVTKREDANMDDFAKQRDQLIQTMLSQKQGRVYEAYLASVKREMEAKKEIQIYEDVLAKLEESLGPDEPQMPQFPAGFPPPQ